MPVNLTVSSHPEVSFSDLGTLFHAQFSDLSNGLQIEYTYDGQAALFQLLSSLYSASRRYVLLPAFHCPTVVEPAIRAGLRPIFYRVMPNLSVDETDLLSKLDNNVAAVVVINYIGFTQSISNVSTACKDSGAKLIEDCAHSFLNADPVRLAGEIGDAAIFSFKKLAPTYVGGGIRLNDPSIKLQSKSRHPPLKDTVVNCKRLLDQAMRSLEPGRIRKAYERLDIWRVSLKPKRSHSALPIVQRNSLDTMFSYPFDRRLAVSGIPWYALHILRRADLTRIVDVRRRNYSELHSAISGCRLLEPALGPLASATCPWAYPVIAKNRPGIDQKLRRQGVPLFTFGETLHPVMLKIGAVDRNVLDSARYLSNNLLCLSIHQNISPRMQSSHIACIRRQFDDNHTPNCTAG